MKLSEKKVQIPGIERTYYLPVILRDPDIKNTGLLHVSVGFEFQRVLIGSFNEILIGYTEDPDKHSPGETFIEQLLKFQ